MAWHPHPFKAIGDALRGMFSGVRQPRQPSQPDLPATPQRRHQQIRDPFDERHSDDVLREALIERISEWRFEQFDASRVERNVNNMDILDVRIGLSLDREGFRQMAARDPLFWYH